MMRPVLMLLGLMIAAEIASAVLGYQVAYQTGYGAFSMLAGVIAITFFWLWARRSTPLALGMAFSWIGSASVMGWWWMFSILDQPDWMVGNPVLFLFLSVYFHRCDHASGGDRTVVRGFASGCPVAGLADRAGCLRGDLFSTDPHENATNRRLAVRRAGSTTEA